MRSVPRGCICASAAGAAKAGALSKASPGPHNINPEQESSPALKRVIISILLSQAQAVPPSAGIGRTHPKSVIKNYSHQHFSVSLDKSDKRLLINFFYETLREPLCIHSACPP